MSFWEFDEEEYKEYLISEERENTERERKRADEAEARVQEEETKAINNMIITMRELHADDNMIRAKLISMYPSCEKNLDTYLAR